MSVELCCDDVHLFYLAVVVGCKGTDDSKVCEAHNRCKDEVPIHLLHVFSRDEPGIVLGDGSDLISFKFKLLEESDNCHPWLLRSQFPCSAPNFEM